jgi:hypothetical protein
MKFSGCERKAMPRKQWLEYGLQLGVMSVLPLEDLRDMLGGATLTAREERILYVARRADYLESSDEILSKTVDDFLDCRIEVSGRRSGSVVLDLLSYVLNDIRYERVISEGQPVPLKTISSRFSYDSDGPPRSGDEDIWSRSDTHRKCHEFWVIAEREIERTGREWATELSPWSSLVEAGRRLWGDQRIFSVLATIASGIRSRTERGSSARDLFDASAPLCQRVRYARMRSADARYLRETIEQARTSDHKQLFLRVAFVWGRFGDVLGLTREFGQALDTLDESEWGRLFYEVRRIRLFGAARTEVVSKGLIETIRDLKDVSIRSACILALIAPHGLSETIYRLHLADRWEDDDRALEFAQAYALRVPEDVSAKWLPDLDVVRACYKRGLAFESPRTRLRQRMGSEPEWMPIEIARRIASESTEYPGFLVELAQNRVRADVASRIVPVAAVAEREKWFV